MDITNIVDRKAEIRTIERTSQTVKQRIATAAEELNRAGDVALHVEIANESICKFTCILYQKDADGAWANVDAVTHRLLVPAPWGDAGWKRWGLRHWEAVVLRQVLMGRLTDPRPPLFDYNKHSRTWFLNLSDYATLQAATFVLERGAISVVEWRKYSTAYRNAKATVQEAYRNRKTTVQQR